VKLIFKAIVNDWFGRKYSNQKLEYLLNALLSQDYKLFERLLSELVLQTLSYFDTAGKEVEKVYQAFLLGMLVNLPQGYIINSQKESGYGRYDIVVLPPEKTQTAIIFELKTIDDFHGETKDEALDAALRQIEEKQYETDVRKQGYDHIAKLGVTFDGKRV
jgi:hypothetical protein